jgi:hypothetical protein
MKLFTSPYMDEEPGAAGGVEADPAPVADPAPAPASDAKWYDTLPSEMREDQNVTKFDSVESLTKSWLNAQRMIGQDKIPMPQTDEDWGNVYSRLGRPDDVTGYKIEAPEGAEINADAQSAFLDVAHKIGLNQTQVQALAQWEFDQSAANKQASDTASETALNEKANALKAEWGQAFEQNAGIAKRAIAEFATDSDKDFLNNAVIDGVKAGDHPVMAKLFHNIGKAMMESGKLEGLGKEGVMSPQELEDKTSTLMSNPAYTDKRHPEHQMINRQVQELFKQRFG